MRTATLSLCMIAKNEADNIGRCLNSVKDIVDEIILVDTGSTDNTIEIAKAMGAKVIEEEWQNDFSAPRNTSLEHATGDWILFLDCDEELAPDSAVELRQIIDNTPYEAFFVLVTNKTETDIELTFPSIRLFRNRKCFRFRGKIHEQIVNSIIENYGQQSIGHSEIRIIHHGYNASTTHIQAKVHRNLAILEGYPDEKRDGFFFYNLGTEYLRLGEKKKALAAYLKALKMTKPTQSYGPVLVKRTMTTLMELQRYRDAVEQLRYYQTIYPQFNDLVFLEAICHIRCGRYSEGKSRLQDYLAMPPPPAWYPTETVFQGSSVDDFMKRVNALSTGKGCPDISVCIIGKNEADHIGSCIISVNEIAEEVIFVDTGSSDKTPAAAYQLGASVYHMPWHNSFSEARNYALDKAKGEWILVLDADEALPDESREKIVKLLNEGTQKGYLLKICTFLDRTLSPANCHITGQCRLFRRENRRYTGAVLEDVTLSFADDNDIAPVDITINHLHYTAEDKHIAAKRCLKLEVIRSGTAGDPLLQNYALGIEHFYMQDFTSAVKCLDYCLERIEYLPIAYLPNVFFYCALSLINNKNYDRAAEVLDQGISLFPDYTDLVYLQAITRFMQGETGGAARLLHQCLAMGETPWDKYTATPGVGSFKAMCSLGTVYARQKNYDEALEMFVQAAAFPGAFDQAVENIVFLKDKLPLPLDRFLAEKGILNDRSLSIASRILAKQGRYHDSLKYLSLASGLMAKEPAPRSYTNIIQAIDTLLGKFISEASQNLPEDSVFTKELNI
ncbi:MAG: glycosyltransferase [Peptococcaceae bacterium]|nr:glycosyltransferase [Peptococcaceae bacterium]